MVWLSGAILGDTVTYKSVTESEQRWRISAEGEAHLETSFLRYSACERVISFLWVLWDGSVISIGRKETLKREKIKKIGTFLKGRENKERNLDPPSWKIDIVVTKTGSHISSFSLSQISKSGKAEFSSLLLFNFLSILFIQLFSGENRALLKE